MPVPAPECAVCAHREGNRIHLASEKMFGWGEEYRYLECSGCGCLQLLDPPSDLARFYPDHYHSLQAPRPNGKSAALPAVLEGLHLQRSNRILDVGCGAGALLVELQALGFAHVEGVEPNLRAGAHPFIHRCRLEDMGAGPWDVIMLHHSFEHMPDPQAVLQAIAARLAPSGECLIRIPVARSWAWRHYGVNWVQLDAPRHLFLHTEASVQRLAERAGLRVREVRYDSTDFQFWGSELYAAGRPLVAAPGTSLWTRRRARWRRLAATRMRRFHARADRLNRLGQGDSAAFYLASASTSGTPTPR